LHLGNFFVVLIPDTDYSMKIVLVNGGVISGVGKGIIASSAGLLLKTMGLRVTALKIDPYLNTDAGLLNPLEYISSDDATRFNKTNRLSGMENASFWPMVAVSCLTGNRIRRL
jgi:hypothetical protein